MFRKVKSQKRFDRTHFTHFSQSFATRHCFDVCVQFLQRRIAKKSIFNEFNCWRRRRNDDDLLILSIEKIDFSRREIRRRKMMLRSHLTCLKQRENKNIIWSKTHDARKMIQTSKVHDARRMIQTSRVHDVRKMIQMNKTHNAHKMKSMSKTFFYCYKVANDQKNFLFCCCVQFKLSI